MFHMLIANEFDEISDELLTPALVIAKLQTRLIEIHHASLGTDFIMGHAGAGVYFLPLSSIRELSGLENIAQRQVCFEQILAAQQEPVMIHYNLPESIASAWLLTVSSPWLRLAHPQGVIWVPLSRVAYAEIRQLGSRKVCGLE